MEARVLSILSYKATAEVSPDYGPVILGMGTSWQKADRWTVPSSTGTRAWGELRFPLKWEERANGPQTSPRLQGDHPGLIKNLLKPCAQSTSLLLPFSSLSYPPFFPHSLPSVFPVILSSSCFSTACAFPPLLSALPSLAVALGAGRRDTAWVSCLLTWLRL